MTKVSCIRFSEHNWHCHSVSWEWYVVVIVAVVVGLCLGFLAHRVRSIKRDK